MKETATSKSKENRFKKGLIMGVLSKLVEGAENANPAINKFVQEQFDQLLKSSKLLELVERVSFQENISRDKALKSILEKMSMQAEETMKKSSRKSAANLELILR